MKTKEKTLRKIVSFVVIAIILLTSTNVFADSIKEAETTEAYKKWEKLSDEEKQNTIMPRKYKVKYSQDNSQLFRSVKNPFKLRNMMTSRLEADWSLKDYIPNNVKIKNQEQTNWCWAFSSIATLESTLALKDYKQTNEEGEVYDFSEKHMVYSSSSNSFTDGTNERGFSRKASAGGNHLIAEIYLTNGSGAIPEEEMEFVNSQEDIPISSIEGKTVSSTIYDTVYFPNTEEAQVSDIKDQMKEHLMNYGAISASIHGAQIDSPYYNNSTAAIYCPSSAEDAEIDHEVVIVGWDDTFAKEKFGKGDNAAEYQPSSNGAWIIKNSWGSGETITAEEVQQERQILFAHQEEILGEVIYSSLEEVTIDAVAQIYKEAYGDEAVTINEDGSIDIKVGDNGYMYISYEDRNIYTDLWGITNAVAKKDYYNIYQNDLLGRVGSIRMSGQNLTDKIYLANVFDRNDTDEELKAITFDTGYATTCKAYVNPDGTSKAKSDLQEVELEVNQIEPGYHSLKLKEPIKLTGESFVVVLELQNDIDIPIESNTILSDQAIIGENESFYATSEDFEQNRWTDLAKIAQIYQGNVCIKALTDEIDPDELSSIAITNPPTTTQYEEGEDFNTDGMEVTATYNNGDTAVVTNYEVLDGESLQKNQTEVTIKYTEDKVTKTTKQEVTVTPKEGNEDPISSDFTDAKAGITYVKMYTEENEVKANVTIKVEDLQIGDIKDTYSYYFYLSDKDDLENIDTNKWIKIDNTTLKKESDGTYSLTFTFDLSKVVNAQELQDAKELYIYLKEIASINNKQKENVECIKLNIEDAQIDTDDIKDQKPDKTDTPEDKDSTTAPGTIPQTGIVPIIIIGIATILVLGIITYRRYNNIDK